MMPYFWKTTPPLTAQALFDTHGEESEGHDNHGNYNEATLRRAIHTGQDPAEQALDNFMPRWHMPEDDMADLIAFLKS